ncbi:MAG: heme biosynthesis protein HemY [Rhodocyclaceae bacterium]|nr:heme biosynthesis protein HemY [Rhodocyclaceae bacterium]
MRALLWVVTLFGVAVGLAVLAQAQQGIVQFVFPSMRIELALSLFMLLALLFGIAFGTLLRLVRAALSLPRRVSAHREAIAERRARSELDAALRAYFENRWSRAERHAARAIDTRSTSVLAQIVAARASQAQRQYARAEAYLDRPTAASGDERWMAELARAELLVQRKRAAEALPLLQRLRKRAPTHSGALRLEAQAQLNAGQWREVLRVTEQAAKHGALDPASLTQYRETATIGALQDCGSDVAALQRLWRDTPPELRQRPPLAMAAARALAKAGERPAALACLGGALDAQWSSEVAALHLEIAGETEGAQALQRGEDWLVTHPADGGLLHALGQLCRRRGLWGKARNYLEAAVAVEASARTHLALAELLESLGEHAAALPHLRAAAHMAVDTPAPG